MYERANRVTTACSRLASASLRRAAEARVRQGTCAREITALVRCETAPVHGGDGPTVACDTDEARQALLARLDRRLERAPRPHRLVPVVRMPERMELDQIDVIDAQPVERAVDVFPSLGAGSRPGLGREEEVLPVTRHPRADEELGVPVPRGGVDVVDAVAQQHVERAIRVRLAGLGQRGRAEERHRALVTRPSGWPLLDH